MSTHVGPKLLRNARVALIYGPGHLGVDYASSLFRGIERALLELGADVRSFNFALVKHLVQSGEYENDSPLVIRLVEFLDEEAGPVPFDFCLGLFHDSYLTPRLQEKLRERCKVVINYPLNLSDQMERFRAANGFCDQVFCSEEAVVPTLVEQLGATRVTYVPMAADPFIHRNVGTPIEPSVLFVGSIYADRLWLLEAISKRIPVSIYGPNYGVERVLKEYVSVAPVGAFPKPNLFGFVRATYRALLRDRRLVSDEEFVRLAARHGISVGLSSVREEKSGALVKKVRLREYEATMCGLCHIAQRLPELERSFDDRSEILLYDTEEEIFAIVDEVRAGSLDWRRIGTNARRRALAEHTWTRRLEKAFS